MSHASSKVVHAPKITSGKHLVNDDQDQIKIWANMKDWNFPRGDLFQFVGVLNRFDAILETTCQEYELDKHIQKKPFQHLNNLLNTTDIDILESVLRLMSKPAQRVNNPKAVQSSFIAPQDKVTELARGGNITDLMADTVDVNKDINKVSMSFYRTEGDEGLELITFRADQSMTDQDLFWKTVNEHDIPEEYHFELLNRIRIANHTTQVSVKRQLLIIRFIAIVIMAHTMSETIAQNRVFIYEPHLVPQIAHLVSYDTHVPIDIQTYALYALDGIARHRTKVTEVLTAFNASVNHGVLLHILRQFSQGTTVYTVDFLDAFFNLLTFLFQTQAGGQMLMSAGIMSTLIQIMDNVKTKTGIHIKVLIKVVGLLDTIMNNVNTSFSSFCSENGLSSLLKVIETQVDQCIAIQHIDNYDSLTLVKNTLRFLIRMMESSDTADGLRNLIESSIPHTIKKVLQHHKLFGSSVFSLVVNVTTTFIHNEPTSLSVLQEIKLPQTFLNTFLEYDQPDCEVLMASVHAFGAICLNSAGLQMFNEAKPLPHFFELMTKPSFVTNPVEVGGVTALGTTMDELIRHHPKLKTEVFMCANQLLLNVIKVGNSEEGKPLNNSHQLVYERQEDEKTECLLLGHVDLVARFLEGFLRNTDNVKEFVNYNGPDLLLSYYALPMLPYNFSVTNAFDSLSFVFRLISDVSPMPFAKLITQRVYDASRFIFSGELDHDKSSVFEYTNIDGRDQELLKKGNDLFRKCSVLFGYIGLLSTVFANAILTNTKNAVKFVEWSIETDENRSNLVLLLGSIHRTMVWQNILLRECVPKAWYNTSTQASEDTSVVDLKDPRVINVRRFKLLLSEIPPALMPVLQGIIKVSVNRRSVSSTMLSITQRSEKVAYHIADVFNDNLRYMRDDSPICKYDYYASMFSMISMLLLDDRSRTALETPVAVAFEQKGNIDFLVNNLLQKFWKAAEAQIEQDNQCEDGSQLQRINTCIELLLAIVHHLGSSKLFHNSPHTTILTSLHPDDAYGTSMRLNPQHWMATMQLKFSAIYKYLESPLLHKFSRHVLHSLLRCVTQNMKNEEERPIARHVMRGNSIEYEANRIALIEMGFDPALVDSALTRFDGNGLSSLDYLFSRRLVEHPESDGPPHLQISSNLLTSQPLTEQEFNAGIRILVNMWYDRDLATNVLRTSNDMVEATQSLLGYDRLPTRNSSALDTTSRAIESGNAESNSVEHTNTEGTNIENTNIVNTAAENTNTNGQEEEDEDDDQYEDIETEEEEEAEEAMFVDESSVDSSEDTKNNYGEKKLSETIKDLDAIRKEMRSSIPPILSRLVDKRSDIDFEVHDLMIALCCGDPLHLAENTKQTMQLFFGENDKAETKDKRSLFESSINKIRIFALMLREPAIQDVMSLLITTMSKFMDWFDFLDLIVTYPEFPDPKWLTTLFLILEVGLAQADEPKQEPYPTIEGFTTDKNGLHDRPVTPTIVTPENRTTLMNYCINLLNMETLSQDNLISTLRIIVRLTKHHAAAAQFVALGGLEPLFKRPSRSFEAIKIQQAYIIMILRHIIEDKSVLMNCMREWLSFWFTAPPSRYLDVSTYIKNNNSMALRDPETFLQVSSQLCRLPNFKSGNIKTIRYIGQQQQQQSSEENSDSSEEQTQQQQEEKTDTVDTQVISTDNEDGDKYNSSVVVHFLLNQLVQIQSQKEENNIKTGYTGFLLQCLLELISSYPSCKHDIIVFNNNQSLQATDGVVSNHARIRQSILFTLVNKLLPYNAINPTTDQERKRQGISMWVASLLVAMCYDTTHFSNSEQKAQETSEEKLTEIRKHVLDVVYRSFKDTLQPNNSSSTSAKYIRYFALAELCHRILNARPVSISPAAAAAAQNSNKDTVLVVAKLMLEKKFVPVLIAVVSDVDVNFPHAKMILNSILRPLEQLTKLSIRIDRTSFEEEEEERKLEKKDLDDENHDDLYLPMDMDEENDAAQEEVSDLYRNSSLAMYDGTVLEEESTDESSEEEDMEMATSGEEHIDEDGEDDDTSTTGSYVTVDSEENIGGLMRGHGFHHSSVGEDSDGTSDDGNDSDGSSESGMSYSSSSYESSNESLNSDRSDSIHSDDSREMAWHLEDINDESGFMSRNAHDDGRPGRHHHHARQAIQAEIMTDSDDDMDVDQSDLDEDQDSDDLDQDEMDDVERNLELFARGSPLGEGSVNNATGNSSGVGRSFDRDNIILHPLLRSAANPNVTTSADGSFTPETAILSGANSNHLQAYEDIIGGSAVRILENLLSQQHQRNNATSADTHNAQRPARSQPVAANTDEDTSLNQENKDTLNLLQEFQPLQSADRWIQEVQMVYISSVASAKAAKLTHTLMARLIKIAKEEQEKQSLSENGEGNNTTIDTAAPASESEYMELDGSDNEVLTIASDADEVILSLEPEDDDEEEEQVDPMEPEQQERVVVTINGEEVDITGTGIDAEFLEALPDDLRAEVLSQQMAERRSSIQSMEDDTISPEFLDALPPEIREEVIRQESMERNRRQARQQSTEPTEPNNTEDTTSRNLPVAINVTDLGGVEMHPNLGLAGRRLFDFNPMSGPNPRESTNASTWRIGRSSENNAASFGNNSSRKAVLHRDAIRIVDRSQLAILTRLLFVPQSISKALLNRLLLNLCENSKTRGDLLSLLVCILQDGSSDLASVDRSFTQLSILTPGKQHQTSTGSEDIIEPDQPMTEEPSVVKPDENAPNLITQRCLDILYYVVTGNDRSLAYFLTENDSFGHLKRRNSIGRKSKIKDKSGTVLKYPILVLIGLLDRPAFLSNTALMGQLMNLLATMCRPFPSLVKKYKEKMESLKKDDNDVESTEKQHHHAPKPPTIPEEYLAKIVDVLSVGECSSYTFQFTLSVLSYLSALDGALDMIIERLISTANSSGKQIIIDLQELLLILEKYKTGTELQTSALAQFSAVTSHQTKLLRVLKAMDYMYTRKRNVSSNNGKPEENEKQVLEIYNKLDFLPLWKMLGACLKVVQDRKDLINVATVLLPLVESFMAVSKYSTNKGYTVSANKPDSNGKPSTEDFFFEFTEEHKKILNIMVRNNPSLMSGSFSLLVHNPKILEFDNKRSYFVQQLHKRTEPREHHPPLQLNVRRALVFEDTYRQLQGRTGKEIKYGKLNVQFQNEEGVDAGGVAREWFSVLARQMFDPNYALFITSAADKLTYQPNRASRINPDHLSFFKCVGRIIGKAIHDGRLLDAYFTRSFYKLMLGRSVDYRDVEAVDPAYYKSLVWMLENDITDIIDLTFSVETDDFGTTDTVDLKPNGRNIQVTEANKHEYVTLITEHKLYLTIKEQVNAFLEGFHDIIPAQLIQIFNEQELELLISGLPDIDIDEWKANTVYEGYTLSSPQIQWFWRAVRSFSQEERAKLLQFATGTSKVPLEGFSELQGSNGVQKFQIHKEFGDANRLPSAHTW
ncbi:hypothetical protein HPULCUR_009599 [Helicostylum pulchrum]|uniref:HECT-type E3 ubiquitin transferase n=1 Tax=Helicostylum pulchrum TaxID=562976 RepID=A0ABP9YC01_9FUNG